MTNLLRATILKEIMENVGSTEIDIYLILSITDIIIVSNDHKEVMKYTSLMELINDYFDDLDDVITQYYQGKMEIIYRYEGQGKNGLDIYSYDIIHK